MRMGPDRTPDVRIGFGDRAHALELVEPSANRQHRTDARRTCAGKNRFTLGGEIGKVEMAMSVNQHCRPALPAAHIAGASTKRGKIPSGFGNRVPGTNGAAASAAKSRDSSDTASWSRSLSEAAGTKGWVIIARCRIVSARMRTVLYTLAETIRHLARV